jgi:hypothetical protein
MFGFLLFELSHPLALEMLEFADSSDCISHRDRIRI